MTYFSNNVTASQIGANTVSIASARPYGMIMLPPEEARKLGEWLCHVEVPAPEKPSRGEITLEEARATYKGKREYPG